MEGQAETRGLESGQREQESLEQRLGRAAGCIHLPWPKASTGSSAALLVAGRTAAAGAVHASAAAGPVWCGVVWCGGGSEAARRLQGCLVGVTGAQFGEQGTGGSRGEVF